MRFLPVVNVMLILGFLSVVATAVFVMGWREYSDQATESIFILHSANFFLLVIRAAIRGK